MNFPEYIPLHGQWWSALLFILGAGALLFGPVTLVTFFAELKARDSKADRRRAGYGVAFLVCTALAVNLVTSLVNFTHAYNANKEAWANRVVMYMNSSYGLELEHDDVYRLVNGTTVTVTDEATGKPLLIQLRDIDSKHSELIGADASTLKRIDR